MAPWSRLNRGVFIGSGAAAVGAGPDGTTHYYAVTSQNAKVAATHSNFSAVIDLSQAPAGFWSRVSSDGGNVRFTNSSATQIPGYILSINTSTQVGIAVIECDSISGSVDTEFRVYYGGSATTPSVSDTYGRNNTWSSYAAVYGFIEDPSTTNLIDHTGNGHDLTPAGSMTSGDLVSGPYGADACAWLFDGTDDYASAATVPFSTHPATIFGWVIHDTTAPVVGPILYTADTGGTTDFTGLSERGSTTNAQMASSDAGGAIVSTATSTKSSSFSHFAGRFTNATSITTYWNGTGGTTVTSPTTTPTGVDTTFVGGYNFVSPHRFRNNKQAITGCAASDLGANWISTQYENMINESTFWSVGAEQAA